MGEATRAQAIEKWSTFTPKIGYTEKWKDYSGVVLARDAHFANVRTLQAHLARLNFAKVGAPIDRREWNMPPQQVNAYYNAVWNEIVFPAGILQPPFFDMNADDALELRRHWRRDRPRTAARLRRLRFALRRAGPPEHVVDAR
ncbi:MAG: hypothetical protein IPH76_04410 [Xanthomonadales bacterium]|nr:hypothetical protein [Xanthomonadales bacterium]